MLCCASKSRTMYYLLRVCTLFPQSLTNLSYSSIHSRIAKNALSLQERFDVAAQVPELYNNFYGRFAWRFEPFQVCVNNLRRGFEIGFSSGNNDMGLQCAFQLIKTNIFSGSNLKSLLNEIDYYLHFFKTFQITRGINVLVIFRETVSVLIDKGQATSIEEKTAFEDLNDPGNRLRGVLYFHQAIQAYWSGYTERCQYYIGKYLSVIGQDVRLSTFQMEFYHGKEAEDAVMVMILLLLHSSQLVSFLNLQWCRAQLYRQMEGKEFVQMQRNCPKVYISNERSSCQLGLEFHKQALSIRG